MVGVSVKYGFDIYWRCSWDGVWVHIYLMMTLSVLIDGEVQLCLSSSCLVMVSADDFGQREDKARPASSREPPTRRDSSIIPSTRPPSPPSHQSCTSPDPLHTLEQPQPHSETEKPAPTRQTPR